MLLPLLPGGSSRKRENFLCFKLAPLPPGSRLSGLFFRNLRLCLSQFYVSLQKQIGASGDFPFIRVLVVLVSVVMHDANVIIISGRRPDGNYISFPLFKALRLQIPFVCSSIFHHHSSSRPQPDLPFRQSARLSACIGGTGYSRHFRRAWQHTPAF